MLWHTEDLRPNSTSTTTSRAKKNRTWNSISYKLYYQNWMKNRWWNKRDTVQSNSPSNGILWANNMAYFAYEFAYSRWKLHFIIDLGSCSWLISGFGYQVSFSVSVIILHFCFMPSSRYTEQIIFIFSIGLMDAELWKIVFHFYRIHSHFTGNIQMLNMKQFNPP